MAGCSWGTRCACCPWCWLLPLPALTFPFFPPPLFYFLPLSLPPFLPLSPFLLSRLYFHAGLLVPIFPSFVHFSPSSLDTLAPPSPSLLPPPPLPAAQTCVPSPPCCLFSIALFLLALAVFPAFLVLSPVCVCLGLAKFGLWPQTVSALALTLNLHPLPAPPTLDFLSEH